MQERNDGGYREIATRVGQPRLKGHQTSPTLLREMNKPHSLWVGQESKWTQAAPEILREMNKLPWFAVIKVDYKNYYLPREAHARQPSLEIVAMLYCGPCQLLHAFLRGHSTKQTPGILAMAVTKYSLITSSKRKYPQTPCTQAHPITCTSTWGGRILAQGVPAVNVGFQPWWPSDLAKCKQESTTTKVASEQGSTMRGSATT